MSRARLALLSIGPVLWGAVALGYDPTGLSGAETKCQQGVSKGVAKAWRKMTKCQARCDAKAFAGGNPSDCEYPWGGETLACIDRAVDSGNRAIAKRCETSCPACYDAGGNCDPSGGGFSAWVANEINMNPPLDSVEIFVSLEYTYNLACTDQNTLEAPEAACRADMDAIGGKYFAAVSKCLAKCRYAQAKGKVALDPDPCRPPAADPSTANCYAKARDKFDVQCAARCADPPDCGPGGFPACFDWAQRIESNSLYYDRVPAPFATEGASLVFCPSPSGAFLDE
jgi:hypothetical protein